MHVCKLISLKPLIIWVSLEDPFLLLLALSVSSKFLFSYLLILLSVFHDSPFPPRILNSGCLCIFKSETLKLGLEPSMGIVVEWWASL